MRPYLGGLFVLSFSLATAPIAALAASSVAVVPAAGTAFVHHAVSTTSVGAQRAFDEGLTLVYAFNRDEARKRFERAAALDPTLAVAWWGVALAVGPNLNFDIDADRLAVARGALAKASAIQMRASPEERALIDALDRRYASVSGAPKSSGRRTDPSDSDGLAYRDAMASVHETFPNDDDVTTLYAESIMDVEGWSWPGGSPRGAAAKLAGLLEGVLARDASHVGANHYYVHVMDAAGVAERAVPSAERLSALPAEAAASHLVHMSGHIYLDVGRFIALERDNRRAVDDDRAYAATQKRPPASLDYYRHNLDFYGGGALMLGDDVEIDRAYGFAREIGSGSAALIAARMARWTDVAAVPEPDRARVRDVAFWRYGRGLAAVARNDILGARAELTAYDAAVAPSMKDAFPTMFYGTIRKLLAARIAHLERNDDVAVADLREAIATADEHPPELFAPWYFPMGEWLGWIELGRGNATDAEAAFRADLARTPHNARAEFGLMESISQLGRASDARELAGPIVKNWHGTMRDLRMKGL